MQYSFYIFFIYMVWFGGLSEKILAYQKKKQIKMSLISMMSNNIFFSSKWKKRRIYSMSVLLYDVPLRMLWNAICIFFLLFTILFVCACLCLWFFSGFPVLQLLFFVVVVVCRIFYHFFSIILHHSTILVFPFLMIMVHHCSLYLNRHQSLRQNALKVFRFLLYL